MKKNLATLAIPLFFSIGMSASPALADGNSNRLFIDRDVDTFAVLPDGVSLPEGITANPANGDIYVSTFTGPSKLLRYNRQGKLIAQRDFGAPLLGLEFDRAHGKVYITNVGDFAGTGSKIQRVAADLSQLGDVATIPPNGAPAPRIAGNPDGSSDTITFGSCARLTNTLGFGHSRNLYHFHSFPGAQVRNP